MNKFQIGYPRRYSEQYGKPFRAENKIEWLAVSELYYNILRVAFDVIPLPHYLQLENWLP